MYQLSSYFNGSLSLTPEGRSSGKKKLTPSISRHNNLDSTYTPSRLNSTSKGRLNRPSTEKTQNPEGNEVNFDLPPTFDENEDHEEETTKEDEKRVPEEAEEKIQEEKTIIPTPIVSFKPPQRSPSKKSL